jgi:hypothetical protein
VRGRAAAAGSGPRSAAAGLHARLVDFLGGGEAIRLAVVLLVVASGFAYPGRRLRAPLEITRPGGAVAGFMIAIWLLAVYTVLLATFVYGLQVKQAYPGFVAPRLRVGTFVDAAVTFSVILYLTRRCRAGFHYPSGERSGRAFRPSHRHRASDRSPHLVI